MKAWLKRFFIPHKENSYAPDSLEKAAMTGMLFLVVLSFTASNTLSLLWMSSQWMVSAILPAVIVDLTNQERGTEALGSVRRSALLDEAARLKAEDMAKNEYFAHYSPDGSLPGIGLVKLIIILCTQERISLFILLIQMRLLMRGWIHPHIDKTL